MWVALKNAPEGGNDIASFPPSILNGMKIELGAFGKPTFSVLLQKTVLIW
jgi:hypothetical protein